MEVRLSDAEKIFIVHGAQDGFRNDGRSCGDFRPLQVERGVLATTDGSARVRIGGTDVLAGVKCELVECDDSAAVSQRLSFSVDCSANATPQFMGKGGDDYAEEIADALHIAYDNALALPDIERLTVTTNHYWKLHVDVCILQYGGTVVDASSVAVKAALFDTEIVALRVMKADEKRMTVDLPPEEATWRLNVSSAPLIVSVAKVGTANVVDVTQEEEGCSFAALWVAVVPQGVKEPIVTMTRQAGGGSLDGASVEEMLQLAVDAESALDERLLELLNTETEPTIPGYTFLA